MPSGQTHAEILFRRGCLAEAKQELEKQLAADNRNAAAHCMLGKIAVRQHDYDAAIYHMEYAVAMDADNSEYQNWLGNSYAWAAATAPLRQKPALGRKCRDAYLRALELDDANLAARLGMMNFYRHVPLMLGGGMSRAESEAEEIRRRDPAVGSYALAVLAGQEKRYTAAVQRLTHALSLRPDFYAANCLLGRIALDAGENLEIGAAALRRCLNLVPTETDQSHERVAWWLGQINELRGDVESARLAYETSLRANPSFQPASAALLRLNAG